MSSLSLALSPGAEEIFLTPGETFEGEFTVLNPFAENEPAEVRVSVAPLSFENDTYEVYFDYPMSYNQITKWLEVEDAAFILSPREEHQVHYKITVPEDAPAGGQYAAFLVRALPEKGEDSSSVAISNTSQIAMLLYSTVAGETCQEGQVLENNVPSFFFSSPIKVSYLLENTGNVHLPATATFRVFSLMRNDEVYSNEDSPTVNQIIPGTTLYSERTWDETPQLGIFRVEQEIDFAGVLNREESLVVVAPLWFVILFAAFVVAFFYSLLDHLIRARSVRKASSVPPQSSPRAKSRQKIVKKP